MAQSRQFVKIWKEVNFGVFANPGSPVNGTDFIDIRLDQSNAFTMRPKPAPFTIRGADGANRLIKSGSGMYSISGNLQTLLYPSQAAFLLNWGQALSAGARPDLGSCTIDHVVIADDTGNTPVVKRYLGCKVPDFNLNGNAQQQLFRLNLGLISQKVDPTFTTDPEDAESFYPTGTPYVFQNMASGNGGYLKLANANRTEFSSFNLDIKNVLDATFNEQPYVTRIQWCGRDVTWTNKMVYKTLTDRSNYEAYGEQICAARIDNGTNHVIINFGNASYLTGVDDDLPLDKVYEENLTWVNAFDAAVGTDLVVTVA